LESKIYELENERNSSIRTEKLLEERIKYIQEEKDKLERNLNNKWSAKLEDKDL
jgi:hypothetical protein